MTKIVNMSQMVYSEILIENSIAYSSFSFIFRRFNKLNFRSNTQVINIT